MLFEEEEEEEEDELELFDVLIPLCGCDNLNCLIDNLVSLDKLE
jgi:hypothetical protein